jgi:hypothetical protein
MSGPTFTLTTLWTMYIAAPDKAPVGSFSFVENGEGSFAEIAQAIAHSLGQSKKRPRGENTSTPPIPSARTAGSEPSAPGPNWVGNRGSPDLGPGLQKKIVDGVLEEVDGRSFEELSQEPDTLIMGLLELLSHRGKAKPVAARGHTADDSQSISYLTVTEIKPEYLK